MLQPPPLAADQRREAETRPHRGLRVRLPLRTKLVGLLAFFVVVPIAAMAWILGSTLQDRLETDALASNRETAQLAATLASAHTDRAREALLGVETQIRADVLAGSGRDVTPYLHAATLLDPDLTIVNLFDPGGRLIASSAGERAPLGADLSAETIVRLGMASDGWVMGDAALGIFSGLPVAHHALAIRDDSGRVRGLITAGLSLHRLSTALGTVRVGDQGYVALLGVDRVVLSHPDPTRLLQDGEALAPTSGTELDARRVTLEGREILAGSAPVPGTGWLVAALQPAAELTSPLHALLWQLALIALVVLLLALPAAALVASRVVRPLVTLGRGAERLAAGDFRSPLVVRTGDELEDLAERFNWMARHLDEQRQVRERLVQSERLRALGQLAAGVAHDFNNVLALLALHAESLAERVRQGTSPASVVSSLETIQQAALDGADTVRRIQLFGRQRDDTPLEPVDLDRICLDSVELTRGRWRAQGQQASASIQVALDLGAPPPAEGRTGELREVLANLIINAVDAMPQGGTLTLRTWAEPDAICLAVGDTGLGMSPEVQQRIFEPFYTTKGDSGTGLGLAVSYGVVQGCGGTIAVTSAPGQGTTFTIRLRPARAAASAPAAVASAAPARVLVIEDEPQLRDLLANLLQRDGHEVVVAASGPAGVDLAAREPFALVLSDVAMPELSGWEVARALQTSAPRTPVVFVSGWGDTLDPARLAEHGVRAVLPKPFRAADLRAVVASTLAA